MKPYFTPRYWLNGFALADAKRPVVHQHLGNRSAEMQSPHASQCQRAIDFDIKFTGECVAEHGLARDRHPAALARAVHLHQVPQVIPALR
jgi:hypothetical protein